MNRTKWNISKNKGRWWLIKPKGHPLDYVAEHVGTWEECRDRLEEKLGNR